MGDSSSRLYALIVLPEQDFESFRPFKMNHDDLCELDNFYDTIQISTRERFPPDHYKCVTPVPAKGYPFQEPSMTKMPRNYSYTYTGDMLTT